MEHLILSADGLLSVYLVPEKVINNLEKYCNEFWDWMQKSPYADKYRVDIGDSIGLSYNEHDFVEYLNEWVFPDKPSQLVEKLDGVYERNNIPIKYKHCKWFNF